MFIGERGCAFMCVLRAQTCEQHYISSVGAQAAILIETQIGPNTHWGNRHNLHESAIASANSCAPCARKRARSTTYPALAPNVWTDRDPDWYKHSLGQSAQVMGVGVCIARAASAIMAAQSSRESAKWDNERETREYMNGTWRCSRTLAHSSYRGAWSRKS
jgi:hypothetical protein